METKDLPQFPDFIPLRLEHKNLIRANLLKLQPEISELNFTEMFIWREIRGISLCQLRGNICILAGKENLFYPPLGKNQIVETIQDLLIRQKHSEKPRQIYGISDSILNKFTGAAENFVSEINRDYADYVYLTKDLIELNGHKYDGKRNLIKQFKNNYGFEYISITKELIPECLEFQGKWCATHNCIQNHPLNEENIAALELLNNFEHLNVFGATIKINGVIEAFTAASELNTGTAVIHLEKGNPTIKGIYQVINQMFCENRLKKYVYVNREQDMGVDGLRKSKMSYHPNHMVNKNILLKSDE